MPVAVKLKFIVLKAGCQTRLEEGEDITFSLPQMTFGSIRFLGVSTFQIFIAYWNLIEAYIRDHTEAAFNNSICPDCIKKLYPELNGDK